MEVRRIRLEPQRRLVLGDRLVQPAGLPEAGIAQIEMRLDAVRAQPQRRLILVDRLRPTARPRPGVPQIVSSFRIIGPQANAARYWAIASSVRPGNLARALPRLSRASG